MEHQCNETHDFTRFQEFHHRGFAHGSRDLIRFPWLPPSRSAHGTKDITCFQWSLPSWTCTWNPRFYPFSEKSAIVDLHIELTITCVFVKQTRQRTFAYGNHTFPNNTAILHLHLQVTTKHFPRPTAEVTIWFNCGAKSNNMTTYLFHSPLEDWCCFHWYFQQCQFALMGALVNLFY